MRRATLAAGRRVADRGRLANPSDAGGQPRRDVRACCGHGWSVRGRACCAAPNTARPTPPKTSRLPRPAGPAPARPAALPPRSAAHARDSSASGHVFGSSEVQNEESVAHGIAASKGVYEGPARRVSGPSEFGPDRQGRRARHRIDERGFQHPPPTARGIVTDNGGLLSHAAIVSREYGIPGVVGTREATELIANGVLVRVEGTPARSRCSGEERSSPSRKRARHRSTGRRP